MRRLIEAELQSKLGDEVDGAAKLVLSTYACKAKKASPHSVVDASAMRLWKAAAVDLISPLLICRSEVLLAIPPQRSHVRAIFKREYSQRSLSGRETPSFFRHLQVC